MEDYQKRMLNEYEELNDKTKKLELFFFNHKDKELHLSNDEVVDMRLQLYAMQAYRDSLGRRCFRQGIKISDFGNYNRAQ